MRQASALTQGLEVERNKLAAHVPKELGHVVGRVHAGTLRVDAAELLFIVSEVGSQGPCRLPVPAPPGQHSRPILGSCQPTSRPLLKMPFWPPPLGRGPVRFPRLTPNPDQSARVSGPCTGGISGLRTSEQVSEHPHPGLPALAMWKDTPQTPWGSWSVAP